MRKAQEGDKVISSFLSAWPEEPSGDVCDDWQGQILMRDRYRLVNRDGLCTIKCMIQSEGPENRS